MRYGFLEFGREDLGERRNGERRKDGDEDEDELVGDDDSFPFVRPILEGPSVNDLEQQEREYNNYQRVFCVVGRPRNEDELLGGHRLAI